MIILIAITALHGCTSTSDLSKRKTALVRGDVSESRPPGNSSPVPALAADKEIQQREAAPLNQAPKPETAQVVAHESSPAVTKAIHVIYEGEVPSYVRELVQAKLTDAGFLLTDADDDRDGIVRITYSAKDGDPYGIGLAPSMKSAYNSRIISCALTFTHSRGAISFTDTCSAESGAVSGTPFTIQSNIGESAVRNFKAALSHHQFWLRLAALRSNGNDQNR